MKSLVISIILFLSLSFKNGYSQGYALGSSKATISWGHYLPQYKYPIDTANLLVSYTYTFIWDTTKKNRFTDKYLLEIGQNFSHYYSVFAEKSDSNMYVFNNSKTNKKVDAATNPSKFLKPNERANYEVIYFNYAENRIYVTNVIVLYAYSYRETPAPALEWNMLPDTMNVLGYSCQLAKTSFRGRNYEAWFTLEIPISRGPWKFSGLPGLILKVQTDDLDFCFEATGIVAPKTVHPIHMYGYQFREITREKMLRLYRMSYQDPAGLVLQHGGTYGGVDDSGKTRFFQSGEKVFPYVPFLELE